MEFEAPEEFVEFIGGVEVGFELAGGEFAQDHDGSGNAFSISPSVFCGEGIRKLASPPGHMMLRRGQDGAPRAASTRSKSSMTVTA
jgi:hypothetical protein